MSSHDFYDVLGVDPNASPDEVRRAYYRKVKSHTPEKDPGMFQVVREAYETLSVPRRRAEYDSLRQHGGQIATLIAEATEALEDERAEDAIAPLRRAIALNPHSEASWSMLGAAYMRLEAYDDAKKVYSRLVQDHPDTADHHAHLGVCFLERGDFEGARGRFLCAHQLEPYNAFYCILVSRCYRSEEKWLKAASWAEKAIGADGKEDVQDFDALVELAIIHALQGKADDVAAVAVRASAALEDDTDAREYGAMRFAAIGAQFWNAKNVEAARSCLKAAVLLAPHLSELQEAARGIENAAVAVAECRKIDSDQAIILPLKVLVGCRVYVSLSLVEMDEVEQVVQKAMEALPTWSKEDIERSINRLRAYPATYRMTEDVLDALRASMDRRQSGPADSPLVSCCGCLVLTVILYIIYVASTG